MRHLNPEIERLEERVAPCLGLPVCIGLCGGGQSSAGGSGSSARSNDGSSASGSKSSKTQTHESCSS